MTCHGFAKLISAASCVASIAACESPTDVLPTHRNNGFDDEALSGPIYVINEAAIGGCDTPTCRGNRLGLLPLASVDRDEACRRLIADSRIMFLELAGLDDDFVGSPSKFTLKVYRQSKVTGSYCAGSFETLSCNRDYIVDPEDLTGVQARLRMPGEFDGREFTLSSTETLSLGTIPGSQAEFTLLNLTLSGRIPVSGANLLPDFLHGTISGMLPMRILAEARDGVDESSWLELLTRAGVNADFDTDRDGLECLVDVDGAGTITRCCDGSSVGCVDSASNCVGNQVAPVDPGRPLSCVEDSRMADGFTLLINFSAFRCPFRVKTS